MSAGNSGHSYDENEDRSSYRRWHDQDPALRKALEQLREAQDRYQAQIALNIIKIIVEHAFEEQTNTEIEDIEEVLRTLDVGDESIRRRRWYDLHETLLSAIQLLHDCPDDLQRQVIPGIADMIENTLDESLKTG